MNKQMCGILSEGAVIFITITIFLNSLRLSVFISIKFKTNLKKNLHPLLAEVKKSLHPIKYFLKD
jgi:hypothetical protein